MKQKSLNLFYKSFKVVSLVYARKYKISSENSKENFKTLSFRRYSSGYSIGFYPSLQSYDRRGNSLCLLRDLNQACSMIIHRILTNNGKIRDCLFSL